MNELTPHQAKQFAIELKHYEAKVGRPATWGEFRAIRAEYEQSQPLASGKGWVVANV